MIDWVHARLRDDEDYKLSVQERFQFILVDEFQDTSYQQGDILRLLSDYWGENANVFVVGDDDQSIYAFQGARVGNMLEFKKRYGQNLQTVILTNNYRSTQAILDASNQLISNNTLRLVNTEVGLTKELLSAGANTHYPAVAPQIDAYTNEFHEILGVTQEIQLRIAEGTPRMKLPYCIRNIVSPMILSIYFESGAFHLFSIEKSTFLQSLLLIYCSTG